MKRFKFRLQKVLDIKARREDLLKDELAKLIYLWELERQKLNAIIQSIEQAHLDKADAQKKEKLNPQEVIQFQNHIQGLFWQQQAQELQVQQAKILVDQKREELIEASKEKKILVKLREKQEFNYLWELDKAEQKIIDEIASHQDFKHNPNRIQLSKIVQES